MKYISPSSDSIFPADLESSDGYWIDSSEHPHILGCQDSTEICNSLGACLDLDENWDYFNASSDRPASEAAVLNLLGFSLSLSTTRIVSFELKVPRLLVDRLHSGSLSLGLGSNHWHSEARRLFEISLARLQVTVFNTARGKNGNKDNYQLTPHEAGIFNQACSSFKIQTVGWKNISLLEFIFFLDIPSIPMDLDNRVWRAHHPCMDLQTSNGTSTPTT